MGARWWVLAAVAGLAACGSSSSHSGGPIRGPEGSTIVTPADFAPSTSSDVTNGPLTAKSMDSKMGVPGAAEKLGFKAGYDETFDQVGGADYVEVTVIQFDTPGEATAFEHITTDALESSGMKQSSFSGIPDAVELDTTNPATASTVEHAVAAVKGDLLLAVDYNAESTEGVPVADIAIEEYQHL